MLCLFGQMADQMGSFRYSEIFAHSATSNRARSIWLFAGVTTPQMSSKLRTCRLPTIGALDEIIDLSDLTLCHVGHTRFRAFCFCQNLDLKAVVRNELAAP